MENAPHYYAQRVLVCRHDLERNPTCAVCNDPLEQGSIAYSVPGGLVHAGRCLRLWRCRVSHALLTRGTPLIGIAHSLGVTYRSVLRYLA